jgi:hypothetical protein
MFERISRGFELTRQSLGVLREEKTLLVFPFLSGLACLLVLASFAVPVWLTGYAQIVFGEGPVPRDPVAYLLLFLFYFANYFVIVFFNSALVSCAIIRFHGGDATLGDGLRAASSRLPQIAGWALVSASVGVLLKALESRSKILGRIAAALLGGAWSIATYFVVPVLVVEGVGPIEAVKRSFAVLRKTWGESLVANFGIGLVIFLAMLVAAVPLFVGAALGTAATLLVGLAISVVAIIVLSLVSAALHAIIVAALYLYAAKGEVPRQFDEQLLRSAYGPK